MVMGWDDAAVAVGSFIGGRALDTFLNRQNAGMTNDASIDMARHMPQAQMEGLRNAGLNPMLAVNKLQFPAASASSIQSASGDLSQSLSSASQAASQRDQTASNVLLQREQAHSVMADAGIKEGNLRLLLGYLDAIADEFGGKLATTSEGQFMRQVRVLPELQSAAADVAERANVEELQKFLNIPAANELMKFGQLAIRLFLGLKGSSSTVNRNVRIIPGVPGKGD